jgi:hypothetical protein
MSNASTPQLKTAAVGTICKVRRGAHHIFLRTSCRVLVKASDGAAGLDRILQAELRHLANTFPARSISLGQGQTELLPSRRPATFRTLRMLSTRLRQWTQYANCGVGHTTFVSEARAERGWGEGKRGSCWAGSHQAELRHLANQFPRGVFRLARAARKSSNRGLPQPVEHFEFSTQYCCSWHNLQSEARSTPHFSPKPVPGQARELLGWIASSKANYDTLPKHFPRRACRLALAARNFCISGVPQHFEHFDSSAQDCGSGHNLQSEARGTPHFSPNLAPSFGAGKRWSCWAESHPPSRTTTPCQHISLEEHFAWPRPHGNSGVPQPFEHFELSLKTAAVDTICKVRSGPHHICPRNPCRAGGRQARELLSWIASSMPNYDTLPTSSREEYFAWPGPHGTYAFVASRNLSNTSHSQLTTAGVGTICKVLREAHPCQNIAREGHVDWPGPHGTGVPQPFECFECSAQYCGSGHHLQSAARGTPHFSPKPVPSGGGTASEGAAGLDRILQAELRHLTKHFPRGAFRLARATRNF